MLPNFFPGYSKLFTFLSICKDIPYTHKILCQTVGLVTQLTGFSWKRKIHLFQAWEPRGVTRSKMLPSAGQSQEHTKCSSAWNQQSAQSLCHVWLFVTPWTAACQASLSITISWSLFKLLSIESVMPPNHLILCCPLFLLPSIFPSIRVFSSESVLHFRWPKYWSFSFSISLSNEYSGLISFRIDWLDLLQSKGLSRVFCSITLQKHQFFGSQLFLWSISLKR